MPLVTLKRRSEYLRVRGGSKWSCPAFLIESKRRPAGEGICGARFGFTVTKKLGGAVIRNRIRRRLREAVRATSVGAADEGCDYVIVARPAALERPFTDIKNDFTTAFAALRSKTRREARTSSKPGAH